LHPIIVEKDEPMQESVEKEEKKYEEPESIPCWLYRRKNLGIAADTVRGAAFSIVKGLTEPFDSLDLAISWIREHGEKEFVYQLRALENSRVIQHWVFDERRQWHKTEFRQDPTRGYKSDKKPHSRIH
jgi:hypothetical protein